MKFIFRNRLQNVRKVLILSAFAAVTVFVTASCKQKGDLNFSDNPSNSPEHINFAIKPASSTVRMLNSREFRTTIRDLLSVEIDGNLVFGMERSGFDTASDSRLDENLLNVLMDQVQSAAAQYVDGRLRQEFGCLDPGNIEFTCLGFFVETFGRRAHRRPLSDEQKSDLLVFFTNALTDTGSSRAALENLITRILLSSNFLYRSEVGKLVDGNGVQQLDVFERASFISYTVAGTTPDDQLLEDAMANNLSESRIKHHVRRLLGTPNGREQTVRFFKQWLKVTELDDMVKNPQNYPKLSGFEQANALREEFQWFVTDIILDGEGTLTAFLTETFARVNRHNAPFYGLSRDSDEMVKTELSPNRRSGFLTLASVMTVMSSAADHTRDRPVLRGTLVSGRLLCKDIGLPSGISTDSARKEALERHPNYDQYTVREQFEAVMQQSQQCMDCHKEFMPYGYVLGNYNARGEYVTIQKGRPINPVVSEVFMDGKRRNYNDAVTFIGDLSKDERVYRCFVEHFVKFMTGGGGATSDGLSRSFFPKFKQGYFDVVKLMENVLSSNHLYVREN